jgi:hypothetical protein
MNQCQGASKATKGKASGGDGAPEAENGGAYDGHSVIGKIDDQGSYSAPAEASGITILS